MHANTDPVKFDFGMADTLVSSFKILPDVN